jgi:thiol-disulfide isomerase/thioredoxin
MPVALGIVLGVLLAIVFVVAAFGKLTDAAGTRAALRDFGVPHVLSKPVALALPAGELSVAVLLLFGSTRVAGAVGALGLLAMFSVAIGANLARGRTPECHCFGRLHSAPAGLGTLARNAVLAGGAAAVLVAGDGHPGPGAFAWVGKLGLAETLALAAVLGAVALAVAGGVAFVSLMRSHGRLLLELDTLRRSLQEAGIAIAPESTLVELGRDPGTMAPEFAAETVTGQRISLGDLLEPGLPLLLTFTSPSCGPCRALLPALSRWQHEHAAALRLATVSSGEPAAIGREIADHDLGAVLVDHEGAVYEAYQATGTPSAVLISADGRIASYLAAGADAIEQLLDSALRGDGETEGLPIGTPAPPLDLHDLDGGAVQWADPNGRDTLVLFWNPGCGFCDSMRSDLHAWEQNAGSDAPRLLVVSSGDPEQSRADGFGSVVALDADYSAGEAFGAAGTPMAVLLGADGRIASGLVTGGAAVLALARARRGAPGETLIRVMR